MIKHEYSSGDNLKEMANENDNKDNPIEILFEKVKDYAETRGDLLRLKAIKKTSEVGSSIISKIIIAVFFMSFIMIFNIAIGLWLGEVLGKDYFGFFALASFYLIIGIIVYATREKVLKLPLADSIIKKIND